MDNGQGATDKSTEWSMRHGMRWIEAMEADAVMQRMRMNICQDAEMEKYDASPDDAEPNK